MLVYDGFEPTGCLMSEKFDGIHAVWDGRRLSTRTGNVIAAPDWWLDELPAGCCLVGELWIGRGSFEQTCSVVGSRDAGGRWHDVQLMVFPGSPKCTLSRYASRVAQHRCQSAAHLQQFYEQVVAGGGEGVVILAGSALYKHKPISDDDGQVIAHTEGRGRNAGRLGALVIRDRQGREFRLGVGLSDHDRDQPPPIGAIVLFEFQGRTKRGLPRFANYLGQRAEESLAF